MSDETLTLERLLRTAVQVACSESGAALLSYGEDAAMERVQALLTPAGRLSMIADLVSGLPHGTESDSPGLELGHSAEAFALVGGIPETPACPGIDEPHYVARRLGGLWIGASMPKTEGK